MEKKKRLARCKLRIYSAIESPQVGENYLRARNSPRTSCWKGRIVRCVPLKYYDSLRDATLIGAWWCLHLRLLSLFLVAVASLRTASFFIHKVRQRKPCRLWQIACVSLPLNCTTCKRCRLWLCGKSFGIKNSSPEKSSEALLCLRVFWLSKVLVVICHHKFFLFFYEKSILRVWHHRRHICRKLFLFFRGRPCGIPNWYLVLAVTVVVRRQVRIESHHERLSLIPFLVW